MTNAITTLIALPYEIARLPLVAVDRGLAGRLSETSGPRVTLDRTLGSADKLAGALLPPRGIAQRGVDRIERSGKLLAAERLEQEADTRREQARETAKAGRQQATRTRTAAQKRAESGLQEADATEARAKKQAEAEATQAAAAKKKAADERAAKKKATVAQSKKRATSAADAKKKAAQREAKSELDEARETKKAAADARADAARLSELTEAKKQERKQD